MSKIEWPSDALERFGPDVTTVTTTSTAWTDDVAAHDHDLVYVHSWDLWELHPTNNGTYPALPSECRVCRDTLRQDEQGGICGDCLAQETIG